MLVPKRARLDNMEAHLPALRPRVSLLLDIKPSVILHYKTPPPCSPTGQDAQVFLPPIRIRHAALLSPRRTLCCLPRFRPQHPSHER